MARLDAEPWARSSPLNAIVHDGTVELWVSSAPRKRTRRFARGSRADARSSCGQQQLDRRARHVYTEQRSSPGAYAVVSRGTTKRTGASDQGCFLMANIEMRKRLRHHWADLFKLVAELERYPEFVPCCQRTRVLSRTANGPDRTVIVSRMTVRNLGLARELRQPDRRRSEQTPDQRGMPSTVRCAISTYCGHSILTVTSGRKSASP